MAVSGNASLGKVAITTNPVVATESPARMRYGGVERIAFLYGEALQALGFDVAPVAPQNSWFSKPVDDRYKWPQDALATPDRNPMAFWDDVASASSEYALFTAEVLSEQQPDAILMLGPSYELLSMLDTVSPNLLARVIVSVRNGPSDQSTELLGFLDEHPEVQVTCLTKIHRDSIARTAIERGFPRLAERLQLVRDGVLIGKTTFSPDPAAIRAGNDWDHAGWDIDLRDRKLISQVDYFSPNKGQLLTTLAFARSGLAERGFDLVLAGGFGWQLPSRNPADPGVQGPARQYMQRVREVIAENGLEQHVHILDALPGAGVELLNRASDIVALPVRMDHGSEWPGTAGQDPEAHGLSLGHAMAVGTPVLCSDKVEAARMNVGVTGYRFGDLEEYVAAMSAMADDVLAAKVNRAAVRDFAIEHDAINDAVGRYARMCADLAGNTDVKLSDDVIDDAVAEVAAGEHRRAHELLARGSWATERPSFEQPVIDLRFATGPVPRIDVTDSQLGAGK